jgi:hypothetical protein
MLAGSTAAVQPACAAGQSVPYGKCGYVGAPSRDGSGVGVVGGVGSSSTSPGTGAPSYFDLKK